MNVAVSATAISAVSSVSTDTFGTGWPAAIDGCHDLLAVALGTNSMEDTFEPACRQATARPHRGRKIQGYSARAVCWPTMFRSIALGLRSTAIDPRRRPPSRRWFTRFVAAQPS